MKEPHLRLTREATPEEHAYARLLADRLMKRWAEGEPHRHVWWTEQQTGHTRCAYCPAHK